MINNFAHVVSACRMKLDIDNLMTSISDKITKHELISYFFPVSVFLNL